MKTITPVLNGKRVEIKVSENDYEKVTRGLGLKGEITDLETSKTYSLYGKACDMPHCFCDAVIRPTPRAVDDGQAAVKIGQVALPTVN